MSDYSMRFIFSSLCQTDDQILEVSHEVAAEQLDAIYEKFAGFLRASGFDYVRYIGDGMFDKDRWRDYGSLDERMKIEDTIEDIVPTETPFLKKSASKSFEVGDTVKVTDDFYEQNIGLVGAVIGFNATGVPLVRFDPGKAKNGHNGLGGVKGVPRNATNYRYYYNDQITHA